MKYVALAVLGAFAGFVGAWLLFQQTTPEIAVPGVDSLPRSIVSETTRLADEPSVPRPKPVFDDITAAGSIFDQLYLAWQLAAGSGIPELEELLDRTLEHEDPLYRNNIAAIFLERYTELAPEQAMAWVDNEHRLDQVSMKAHILTSWVRYDPEAAIAWLRTIDDRRVRITAGARLLEDPIIAAGGLRDEIADVIGDRRANRILEQLQMRRADPAELFEAAQLMSGQDRRTRLQFAVTRWVEQDAEAALARIQTLGEGQERQRLLQIAVNTYAQQDPEAALGYVQLNYPENQELMAQAINVLATRDPQRALPVAEDFQRRFGDTTALTYVLRAWSEEDPRAAIQYSSTLPASQRRSVYPTLAYTWMQQEPEAAMRWLASLGEEFSEVSRSALQVRSDDAMSAGERVLPTITDPAVREQLITTIAIYKSNRNARDAIDWISTYADEPAWDRALPAIMNTLAQRDPAEAARFIEANANDEGVARSASTVVQTWYRQSPDDAVDWLASMSPSSTRNQAVSHLSTVVAMQQDLDAAIELLDLIPEGSARDNATRQVAFNWVRGSPDRVEDAIARLDLPPSDAERLRQQNR